MASGVNDEKLVFAVVETKDIPNEGSLDISVSLMKGKETKIKPSKSEKSYVWSTEVVSWALPSSNAPNEIVFKAGTSGFMKKKGLGTITIVLSDLENGVPVDDFFPLVHKGEKEGGSIRIQIIKITTSIVWTTRDFLMPIHALLNAERHDSLVTLLKQKKYPFDWQAANEKQLPALHYIAHQQEPDMIPFAIEAGASVAQTISTLKYRPHPEMRGFQIKNCTPLHLASFLTSAKVVAALIQGGSDIHATAGAYSVTPLHIAAAFNNIGPVKELLKAGADPNRGDEMGDTVLHTAAVQAANDVVEPLIRSGVDLWKSNKQGKNMSNLIGSNEVPLSTQMAIIEAAGSVDHREFLMKREMADIKSIHVDGVLKDKWSDCPQFGISLGEDAGDEIIVHVMLHQAHDHTKDNQMKNIGFMVLSSSQSRFRLPTYKLNLLDYGTTDPYKLKIKKGEHFVVSPYVKLSEGAGSFTFIAMCDDPVQVNTLQHWKYELSLPGEWGADSAGGSIQFEKDWAKNPMYVLTLPENEASVEVFIHLEQAQEAADVNPFSLHPYQNHIGFYVFDMSLKEMLFHTKTFMNSQSIYSVFELGTKEANKFIIVPATHEPNQMCRFSLHISSEVEFKVAPVKKTFQ